MATKLQINDRLNAKAMRLGKHQTKKATVTQALVNDVHHLEQVKIKSLFGTIDYDATHDHEKQRERK